jgi:hypothetical protein
MAGTHSMALRRKATDDAPPYDPQIWENDCFYLSRLMRDAKLHSIDTARLSSRTIDPFAANRIDRGPRNASNTGSIHVLPAQPNWLKRQWLWVRNKVFGDGKLTNGILSPVTTASAVTTAGGVQQPRAPLPDLTNKTEAEIQSLLRAATNKSDDELAGRCVRELRRRRESGQSGPSTDATLAAFGLRSLDDNASPSGRRGVGFVGGSTSAAAERGTGHNLFGVRGNDFDSQSRSLAGRGVAPLSTGLGYDALRGQDRAAGQNLGAYGAGYGEASPLGFYGSENGPRTARGRY